MMEQYKRINKYTWVVPNKNPKPKTTASAEADTPKAPPKINNPERYKAFCKEVFKDVDFICEKEFNRIGRAEINVHFSVYKAKMIRLGYISVQNKVVKSLL